MVKYLQKLANIVIAGRVVSNYPQSLYRLKQKQRTLQRDPFHPFKDIYRIFHSASGCVRLDIGPPKSKSLQVIKCVPSILLTLLDWYSIRCSDKS